MDIARRFAGKDAALQLAKMIESGSRIMKTRILPLIVLLLASTGVLFAQSGRKSAGTSSTTTTTTPSVAGPKTTEKKPAATPKVQLLVGMDHSDTFNNVPYYIYDTVLDNVIRRVGEAEIVFANSGGNMSRSDAIKDAKQR